jgi:hypothetical protein
MVERKQDDIANAVDSEKPRDSVNSAEVFNESELPKYTENEKSSVD